MRLAITAASGLVGGRLALASQLHGIEVLPLVRGGKDAPGCVHWDPAKRTLDRGSLEAVDAVVHLSGEPIASDRWSAARKEAILRSRADSTRFLCEELALLKHKPEVLVCASAIGFYGSRGDELLDESSPQGAGFLADVCRQWEAACAPAHAAGIRVVNLRIGMVLSMRGGALPQMLLPFRLGLGGPIGHGQRYMSWIMLDDLVSAILHVLSKPELRGAVNGVSPGPVTNLEFTHALARVLHRPAGLPLPPALLRLVLGEMADALLLSSTRVAPNRLVESGFHFNYPEIEPAFEALLAETRA